MPSYLDTQRPWVTVHYAQTLDGRIATATGCSQWISGDATLGYAHQLRATHQAVLVGIGTVLADNPRLTVRLASGPSPLRIVVDSTLRLPPKANVVVDRAASTLVATTDRASPARAEAFAASGLKVLVVERDPRDLQGRVDLAALFRTLSQQGIHSILIEGGARIITSALRQGLVNRLMITIAPKVIGAGLEAIGDLSITTLDNALTFSQASFTTVGEDIVFDGYLVQERVTAS